MLHNDKTRFNSLNSNIKRDHSPKPTKLTQFKQQFLINFLYKKYSTKYSLKEENQQLRDEIVNYTRNMRSSVELPGLDKIVENLLKLPRSSSLNQAGKRIVVSDTGKQSGDNIKRTNFNLNEDIKVAVKNDRKRNESRESRMSGASELSGYGSYKGSKKEKDNKLNHIKALMSKLGNKEDEVNIEGNEWSLIAEYNRIQFMKDRDIRLRNKKEKQEILKKELEKQVNEKNIVKNKEKEDRSLYGKMVIERVDEYRKQQMQNKLDSYRKSVELKEVRDKLLEDDRMKKKNDLMQRRSKELEIVNLSRLRQQEEMKKINEKKHLEKTIFKQSLEEQKVLMELKKQNRLKESIIANQIEKENEEINEKMHQERNKNRKRTTKSFDAVYNVISHVNSQKESEMKEFEENFINRASERFNKSITMKNDTDEYRKKKELKDYLDQQVYHKLQMKRKNELENRDYGIFLEELKNKFVEESNNEMIKKRSINKENNEFLRKQIESKKDEKQNHMNVNEYSMNKEILSNYYKESSLYK